MFRLLILLCSLVAINGQFGQRTVSRTVTRTSGESGGGIQVIPASGLSGQIQFSNLAQSLPSSSFDQIDGITGYQLVPIRGRTRPAVYTSEVRESGTSGGIAVLGNGGSSQTQTDVTEEVAVDPPLPPLPSSGSSISSSAIGSVTEEGHPAPEPYNFAYSSANEDGSSSSREETGDESGRVTGFYTLVGLDGQERRVDYVADENGFRATVTTNEIGTESKDAADAQYLSSSPPIDQLIAEWEASHPVKESNQQTAIRGAVGSVAVSRPANVATSVVQKQTSTSSSSRAGVSLIGVAPSAGGVTRTETVRSQTAGFGGTVIGVARPASQVSRVQTVTTQTSGGQSSGGVSLVGISPTQGHTTSRVQTVQTQSTSGGSGGLSVIGIGQQPAQGVSRVQTVTQTRGGHSGGVSLVGIAPSRGGSRVQTVHTSGGLGTGGVSLIGFNRPTLQTRVQTVRTQTSGGSGAGGVSFVNLIPTQGVSQIQRVQSQTSNELGAGGVHLVGISPASGGVSRQTSAGYGAYGGLAGALQLNRPSYSSYTTVQNSGHQGLSGLEASNGANLVVVPGTDEGNSILRYLTSNGFQATQGIDGQAVYFLPETAGNEQVIAQ